VRATRSCAAASAWRSSGAGVRRMRQQRGTGRLGDRTQLAGGSAQRRRQVLSEGLSWCGRLDALGVTRRSKEGRWQLHASKGSAEQWPSGTRHRCVRPSSGWQLGGCAPRGTVDRGKPDEEECSSRKPVGEGLSRGAGRDSRGAWSIRAAVMENGDRRCQTYG
jgi:hypothetical protein